MHKFVGNFLCILTENDRLPDFERILAYFTGLYNEKLGIADVTVTSAMPLSDTAAEKIRAKMAEITGKTVNMTLKTDDKLIGGVVISYGNTTIDGSVKARLEQLKADIAASLPIADAITVEADSGGHTDQGVALALFPAIKKICGNCMKKYNYADRIYIGAAGGIGTPEAMLAMFMLGADYVLTGSLNQCTVEADRSTGYRICTCGRYV